MNCDFSHPLPEDPRFRQCPRCGHIGLAELSKACGKPEDGYDIRDMPVYRNGFFDPTATAEGPGTELLGIFKEWSVPECQLCINTAAKMDRLGVDGCREQLPELVNEVLSNSERHPALESAIAAKAAQMPFVGYVAIKFAPRWAKRFALKRIMLVAIERAKKRTPKDDESRGARGQTTDLVQRAVVVLPKPEPRGDQGAVRVQ